MAYIDSSDISMKRCITKAFPLVFLAESVASRAADVRQRCLSSLLPQLKSNFVQNNGQNINIKSVAKAAESKRRKEKRQLHMGHAFVKVLLLLPQHLPPMLAPAPSALMTHRRSNNACLNQLLGPARTQCVLIR